MQQSSQPIRVLIIDDVAETRENLRKLLSFEADIQVVGAAGTGSEGIELARQVDPHVVLMDVNMPGMDGITTTERLLKEAPTAQVVMLSVQDETDYLRRAMLAGARDYLTKPASIDELVGTIHRVFEMGRAQAAGARAAKIEAVRAKPAEEEKARTRGQTVTFFGPKGGTGCTTLAVNTAIALQERLGDGRRVALLDGDLQFGDVGVMLNLRPDRSMGDLADRVQELDRDLLSSVMSAHGSGVKALLSPSRPEAAESLLANVHGNSGRSAMEAILDRMRQDFDVIVADTWSWVDDVSLTLFDAASLIVLVVTPDIPAVKSARLFLDLATKLDYGLENIVLVVNGAGRRGSLRIRQIEKAMMPVTADIPFDERSALTAANRGVPFVVRDRSRPIAESISHLAGLIHDRLWEAGPEIEEAEDEVREGEARGVGGTGLLLLKKVFSRK